MRLVVTLSLLIVAFIHLLPVVGILGAQRLQILYGVGVQEPNLELLMRHRAVLFGLLGIFLVYAAFNPPVQLAAFAAAMVSVVSFLWLAAGVHVRTPQVARVYKADLVAVVACIVGVSAYFSGGGFEAGL